MQKLVEAPGPGHRLHLAYVVETGVPVVFCAICGRMASTRPQKLLSRCENHRTPELVKLLQGVLPGGHKPPLHIGAVFPFSAAFFDCELAPVTWAPHT